MAESKKQEAVRRFGEGLAHQQAGRYAEARACYERGLKLDPGNPDALFLLGQSLFESGEAEAGERKMRAAISARPQAANYRAGLAISLSHAGRAAEAADEFALAVRGIPQDPALWRGLAVSAAQAGRVDAACAAAERWQALAPGDAEATRLTNKFAAQQYFERGAARVREGDDEAAIAAYEAALACDPEAAPIRTNLANLLAQQGRLDAAQAHYEQAIALAPEDALARFNLGMLHLEAGRRLDAAQALEEAAVRAPENGLIAAHLLFQKMHLCRWDGLDALAARVRAAVENATADIPPFIVLSMPGTTAALQRRCAENHSAYLGGGEIFGRPLQDDAEHSLNSSVRRNDGQGRLRVGYLSSDFKNHATAYLMIEMLEAHDRSRFEIFGLSYGMDDHSPMRARVARACEQFVDLAGLPERVAVERIAACELDVLIDLKGYTEGNRSAWLRYRLAPLQINWLGYPGTLGAPWVDALIADAVVVPPPLQGQYSERVWHLPDCYQPNCRERTADTLPTRADEGLPDDAIVLCSFNQTYKITPEIFALWLDVLRESPQAVLWLWASNPWAEAALKQAAVAAGVAPERLVFAEGRPQAAHLARLPIADLALDTFPCNGHTTTSDALWAGVPVLTLQGEAFAARVAASLLAANGLAELIATTPDGYRERLIAYCRDATQRQRLRVHTQTLRTTSECFDGAAFARKFESLLLAMCEAA